MIELLVVTGILVLISGLILFNNRQFKGRILLENLAYDIALSVRQAQVYGISVRQFGDTFDISYGMHFNVQSSSHTYNLFGDTGGVSANGLWDPGEDVSPSPYNIESGYFIARLCVPAGVDPGTCSPVTQIDIVFRRPEPDACISKDGVSGITGEYKCTEGQESARIILQSPQGEETSVVVESTGQISVQ